MSAAPTEQSPATPEEQFTSRWGRLMESLVEGHRLFGAVAYLEAHESVVRRALRRGLFDIRATGGSAGIVNEPDFRPRVFS